MSAAPAVRTVEARTAMLDDLPEMLALAAEFVAESAHGREGGWTFSPRVAEQTFRGAIDVSFADVLVTTDDAGISGCAVVAATRDYVEQRSGYLDKFYVRRRARGTGAARALLAEAARWFDAQRCWHAFATATAGVGADTLFVNLARREGFEVTGPTLVRPAHGSDGSG